MEHAEVCCLDESTRAGTDKILSKKSEHFEPGTFVIYMGERFLILGYRPSDGKMVIDNERATLALNTYSMQWR